MVSVGCFRVEKGVKEAYSGGGGLLVAGLAGHLEGDAIGSGVLELEGSGVEVVEVLVEELEERPGSALFQSDCIQRRGSSFSERSSLAWLIRAHTVPEASFYHTVTAQVPR